MRTVYSTQLHETFLFSILTSRRDRKRINRSIRRLNNSFPSIKPDAQTLLGTGTPAVKRWWLSHTHEEGQKPISPHVHGHTSFASWDCNANYGHARCKYSVLGSVIFINISRYLPFSWNNDENAAASTRRFRMISDTLHLTATLGINGWCPHTTT